MVVSLIQAERICTTLAKAKELRSKVEKTITLGKKGTLHARRQALKRVAQKSALPKLFGVLAERYAGRNGGYTRIIKIGNRKGDCAPMAFIELVDREVKEPSQKTGKDKEQTGKKAKPKDKANAPGKTSAKKTPAKKASAK